MYPEKWTPSRDYYFDATTQEQRFRALKANERTALRKWAAVSLDFNSVYSDCDANVTAQGEKPQIMY
jgi:hypothetical protein